MRSEAERLSRMIGNVLELSKLERGVVDIQLQGGAVTAVLEELQKVLARHVQSQGFALDIHIADNLPPALFDRELLLQILVNCCDNCLKFAAKAAEKRIVITASDEASGVALRVRDFGPGVAPVHLPRIFDSFYRGEDELTRQHKGSGIGLALVRGLMQGMGGQVTARNHPEGGFELRLHLSSEQQSSHGSCSTY